MIVPDESFEVKEKWIVKIVFPQKCLKFHFYSYLNDFQWSYKIEHISYKLFREIYVNIEFCTIFYDF